MSLFDVLALEPEPMAHTIRDKKKLLNRVRRIRGQIDAVEKALDQEQDCSTILLTIAACRGAEWPDRGSGCDGPWALPDDGSAERPVTGRASLAPNLRCGGPGAGGFHRVGGFSARRAASRPLGELRATATAAEHAGLSVAP